MSESVPDKAKHVLDQLILPLAVLELRMAADPDFRCLCADHREALEALSRWEAASDRRRTVRVEEFTRLVAELEQEIMAQLSVS